MKKTLLLIMLVLVLTLTACSNNGTTSDIKPNAEDLQAEYITDGIWPENEYTEGVPVAPGTISYTLLSAGGGYCGIFLEDLTEDEYNAYIKSLEEAGFSVTKEFSEEVKGQNYVTVGQLYMNDKKGLSIQYSPNILAICITLSD